MPSLAFRVKSWLKELTRSVPFVLFVLCPYLNTLKMLMMKAAEGAQLEIMYALRIVGSNRTSSV